MKEFCYLRSMITTEKRIWNDDELEKQVIGKARKAQVKQLKEDVDG